MKKMLNKIESEAEAKMNNVQKKDQPPAKVVVKGEKERYHQKPLTEGEKKRYLKNLPGAIELCTDKVLESRAITPWQYTGNKDTMENAVRKDYLQRPRVSKKEKDSSEEEEDEEDEKPKNKPRIRVFEKQLAEIEEFPFNRKGHREDRED
jgi:hypothetical protein